MRIGGKYVALLVGFVGLSFGMGKAYSAGSVCAKVRIEISQEVTLERQAFEARMTIANDLPEAAVSNISAVLQFLDQEGNQVTYSTPSSTSQDALFFVKPVGTPIQEVASGTSGTLKWMIIPAQGAGGETSAGKLYFAGATLTYRALGRTEIVEVNPDFIFVKPQPNLTLDYFLPEDVFGDDPLTPGIVEPIEPFTLGLRILNEGSGVARSVGVSSGEPRIVDNQQGLLISFSIRSAFVNDVAAAPLALLPIGDLNPGTAGMAGWQMEATLKGKITRFEASYTHSDELGGQVTSLIENVNRHTLLGMVQVDIPGRDSIRDFLAVIGEGLTDEGKVKVFESGGASAILPASANFTNLTMAPLGGKWRISVSPSTTPEGAFVRLQAAFPEGALPAVRRVVRIDGKVLPKTNGWVSKTGTGDRFVNVFDTGATGLLTYDVEFGVAESSNQPPVIGPLRNMFASVGVPFSFSVTAQDPDGAAPILSASQLPVGAVFGSGTSPRQFSWQPTEQQTGNYVLAFQASDGVASSSKSMVLTVTELPFLDEWKRKWFSLGTEGTENWADPDGDGLSNLLEYALDLDPTTSSIDRKPVLGRVQVSGSNYLTLTYVHRTDDAALTLRTVGSSDVSQAADTWAIQNIELENVPQGDLPPGMKRTTVRDSVPLEEAGFRFLRLKVSYQP